MIKPSFIDEIATRLAEVLAASPARDVEKNLKATLTGLLTRLDLVSREEFDVQAQVLANTQAQLHALEERLARLEAEAPLPARDGETTP